MSSMETLKSSSLRATFPFQDWTLLHLFMSVYGESVAVSALGHPAFFCCLSDGTCRQWTNMVARPLKSCDLKAGFDPTPL